VGLEAVWKIFWKLACEMVIGGWLGVEGGLVFFCSTKTPGDRNSIPGCVFTGIHLSHTCTLRFSAEGLDVVCYTTAAAAAAAAVVLRIASWSLRKQALRTHTYSQLS